MPRPTRTSAGLLLLLLAIGYAGASQGNGAAYLLLFFIIALLLVSLIHAWSNVNGTRVQLDAPNPVFAGQELSFPLEALNPGRRDKQALHVSLPSEGNAFAVIDEVRPLSAARAELRFTARRRGCYKTGEVKISSTFPLGFFRASTSTHTEQRYLVYPKPEGALPLPVSSSSSILRQRDGSEVEGDDFSGVRAYIRGESQRHIDWKAAARGHPLMVKQFAAETDETVHLDWTRLSHLEPEDRLSQLAMWVIKAERDQFLYGLVLPGKQIPPGRGEAHSHLCLRELALYPIDPNNR